MSITTLQKITGNSMNSDTLMIDVQKTTQSRLPGLDVNNLPFGKVFTDHMFLAEYHNGTWGKLRLVPYGDLQLSPASSMMHYGQSIFEGLKAFRSDKGEVLLFRPHENQKRLNTSAIRMAMPEVPEEIFMEGLVELLRLDQNWVPAGDGRSLYVRPFLIATDDYIGVKPSDSYMFLVIASPVGAYYDHPLRVKVEKTYFRAVEGGVGYVKASGNYGRSLYPSALAKKEGYDQLIWTDGREHKYVEESGTMNLMFVIDGKLITPNLCDTILAGITRDSVLTLARDWGMTVEERRIPINEVGEALQQGRMSEAFGTGTAATIAHFSHIGHEGVDYMLPALSEDAFSKRVNRALDDIRRGRSADPHNWVYKVC
ncbi:MAG TPA: branched-chain amino acid aminotransferase [Bacteroidia bacterium]|nr:branched-chain amino acid aminotransferase [Bacteroidia bacterium]